MSEFMNHEEEKNKEAARALKKATTDEDAATAMSALAIACLVKRIP
ncbi:MAG: hypothetical protein K6A69_10170 [Lachnospiraceae bacterium]|nr:hypothetical protein [Lachnospiraceae bacterium]